MLENKLAVNTLKDFIGSKVSNIVTAKLGSFVSKEQAFLNSAAWCIHNSIKTRIVFYNYFWRNYHVETLQLDLQLFDQDGKELWRDTRNVLQDETLIIDTAEISCIIKQESFEGYLVFSTILNHKPNPGANLIRFNVDYYSDQNSVSTVHDQAVFAPAMPGKPYALGKMEVVEKGDIGSALIFVNSLSYDDTPVIAKIKVQSLDGKSLDIGDFSIPSKAMRRIELGKEQPELEAFLGGYSGQLIV